MQIQIPKLATRLPIKAESTGDFHTTVVYSLEGAPGIYRRVARNGRAGLNTGDGNAIAIIKDIGLCELVRWSELEQQLRPLMPGVESPISNEEGNPIDAQPEGKGTT